MEPAEVAAELVRWREKAWLRGRRLARAAIEEIVEGIDAGRAVRVEVIDEGRKAAQRSIALKEAFDRGADAENKRLERTAAESAAKLTGAMSPEAQAVAATISGTAWAVRDAIAAALKTHVDHPMAFSFRRSFASPVYAFEYRARAALLGATSPSPYLGITELYLGGCYPIGYLDDRFVVYAP